MELTQNQYIDSKGAVVSTLMDMTSFKSTEARAAYITECERADDEYWQNYSEEEQK